MCVLWYLLLGAVDGLSSGLILSVLGELRDGGHRGGLLSVSLVAVVIVVAAGSAAGEAGEAAAAAFDSTAEAADETPDEGCSDYYADGYADYDWPSGEKGILVMVDTKGRTDHSLAVCLCHALIPSGKGILDVRDLRRHVSNIARIHLDCFVCC